MIINNHKSLWIHIFNMLTHVPELPMKCLFTLSLYFWKVISIVRCFFNGCLFLCYPWQWWSLNQCKYVNRWFQIIDNSKLWVVGWPSWFCVFSFQMQFTSYRKNPYLERRYVNKYLIFFCFMVFIFVLWICVNANCILMDSCMINPTTCMRNQTLA
jgi:hypothetical protein